MCWYLYPVDFWIHCVWGLRRHYILRSGRGWVKLAINLFWPRARIMNRDWVIRHWNRKRTRLLVLKTVIYSVRQTLNCFIVGIQFILQRRAADGGSLFLVASFYHRPSKLTFTSRLSIVRWSCIGIIFRSESRWWLQEWWWNNIWILGSVRVFFA